MSTWVIVWTVTATAIAVGAIAWMAWTAGYDAGWMDHSEGKNR